MQKSDLRIVFMGTPEFAVGTLSALLAAGYPVVGIVTQPDKPVGRHGNTLRPSPVKEFALQNNLPVLQPEKMKDPAFLQELRQWRPNLQIVVAFRMLPEVVWSLPEHGTFNVHASLLPAYRGAAPINWAIINGEKQTGLTTFFLDHEIDTGRIILQHPLSIPPDADVAVMYERMMDEGAHIALRTVELLLEHDGCPPSQEQPAPKPDMPALPTAPKLFKDNCRISWTQTAAQVHNFVRGLSPVPGAWTTLQYNDTDVNSLKIYRARVATQPCQGSAGQLTVADGRLFASCGEGMLEILELQPAGKRRMAANDFVNGLRKNCTWFLR